MRRVDSVRYGLDLVKIRDTLLRMQLSYDIARTRQDEQKIKVKRYVSDHAEAGV